MGRAIITALPVGKRRKSRAVGLCLLALCAAGPFTTVAEAEGMRVITTEPPPPAAKARPHKHFHKRPRASHAPAATAQPAPALPAPSVDAADARQHEENLQAQQRIADASKAAAAASDRMLTWTIVQIVVIIAGVAVILATLWASIRATRAAERAAKTTQDGIRVAREEFLSTHRPLLKVRGFSHDAGMSERDGTLKAMQGRFTIVNVGATRATVKSSRVSFKILDEPLPAPNGNDGGDFIGERVFDAGASDRFTVSNGAYAPPSDSPDGRHRSLCLYGSIVYADELGRTRTTAFCRRYDVKTQRYRAVEDADWDYTE